jgi:hypothetical protein
VRGVDVERIAYLAAQQAAHLLASYSQWAAPVMLLAFRQRLRRKAIWAVVTTAHAQLPEALDVYRPYEVPERAVPTWIVWRTPDGVWLYNEEVGARGLPTLSLALEFIEVATRVAIQEAVKAIPLPRATTRGPRRGVCQGA